MNITGPKALTRLIYLALLFLLPYAILPSAPRCATQPMIEPHSQAMPLMPFLDYLVDETMLMDIEEAARAQGWQPLSGARLPREEGALWLRFTIAPMLPDAKPQTYLLDMGQGIPGNPVLYEPVVNELADAVEWRENLPSQRNIILLPEPGPKSQLCFIRLDGLPGPWFAPMIRTPHNAATNWGSLAKPGAILALGVVAALCLLRALSETGQWRYWTALFVTAALAQAILGMPEAGETYTPRDLAAILLPGICLMFLPHIGRHLMDARRNSRTIDIQLLILSLPGAALALLPLVPGWSWLERWVDLWPVGAAIFIPTALGAWMIGLPGSRRFLLACLILPLFTGLSLLGLDLGVQANILASGPDWGVALGALILAASAMTYNREASKKDEQEEKAPATRVRPLRLETEPVINLEHPLDDPNLRLIPASLEEVGIPEPVPQRPEILERIPDRGVEADNENLLTEAREMALREPVDEIMREASALGKGALPPSARKSVEKMVEACQLLANIISRPGVYPASQVDAHKADGDEIFNLERVLRNAHNSVASIAEYSGIALSWYMPPHLGPLFRGDAVTLEEILRLLLESAARATSRGSIKLSVKRMPDANHDGHLLFTVEDEGHGYPPFSRSSIALARAWELAGQSDGYLSVDCSAGGAAISFSVRLQAVNDQHAQTEASGNFAVALAASEIRERRNLSRIIEAADCMLVESDTQGEVIANQEKKPAPLLIAQGDFARPASADMVREFIRLGRNAGFSSPYILAITPDQSQWRLLKASGFTHAMLEPVDPEVLRRTILRLLNANSFEDPQPDLEKAQDGALFNEKGADLNPHKSEEGSGRRENVPTMLIEQNFSLATTFEGPDWLHGEEDDDLSAAGAQQQAQGEPRAGKTCAATTQQVAASERITEPARESAGNMEDFHEWVGEPMPIGSPVSEATAKDMERRHDRGETKTNDGQPEKSEKAAVTEAGEAMGTAPDEAQTTDQADAQKNGRGDGSEPGQTDEASDSPEGLVMPESDRKNDSSAVRDFVNSSVAMVANTLSSFLKNSNAKNQESAEVAPDPEPEGTPAEDENIDPEIMALIARIDEAMNQANAAYVAKNGPAIAAATGMMAKDADEFGLRRLARLANCVERAARANEMEAVKDLLPDLESAVERNRVIISQKSTV